MDILELDKLKWNNCSFPHVFWCQTRSVVRKRKSKNVEKIKGIKEKLEVMMNVFYDDIFKWMILNHIYMYLLPLFMFPMIRRPVYT